MLKKLAARLFPLCCFLCNFGLVSWQTTSQGPHAELKKASPELHATPACNQPAHGLRESTSEELQRIEHLAERNGFGRMLRTTNFFRELYAREAAAALTTDPQVSGISDLEQTHFQLTPLSGLNTYSPRPPPHTTSV